MNNIYCFNYIVLNKYLNSKSIKYMSNEHRTEQLMTHRYYSNSVTSFGTDTWVDAYQLGVI